MTSSGCNLRDALREWRELGGKVREIHGTGELFLWDARLPGRVAKINRRRKDCARCVTVLIRRLKDVVGR